MTTRTRDPIVCECGHEGFLCCAENDQPFSSLWEAYSLSGFDGLSLTITKFSDMPKDLIAALSPKCPNCGQTGKVTYKKVSSED
jgi:hypothetical protein